MAENSPAYLWYPKDVFSSGRIDELSAQEECWYRRALDRSWLDGGIPADPEKCAKHIGKKCTAKAAEKILEMFFIPAKKDASKMANPRQEKERALFKKKIKQKSDAGKAGMAKRWKQTASGYNSVITENNIPIPISIPKEELRKEEEKREREDPPASEFGPPQNRPAAQSGFYHPALVAIREITKSNPEKILWAKIGAAIGVDVDTARLAECYTEWVAHGFKKTNYAWALEWYPNGIPENKPNGTRSNGHGNSQKSDREIIEQGLDDIRAKHAKLRTGNGTPPSD